MPRINAETLNLEERVIRTNKVQKTHKGGRTMSWSALVVVGDHEGHVGIGLGKARGVPDAIRKGIEDAKKSMIEVPLIATTLPHEMLGQAGSSRVLVRPAAPGTGVVAGGSVRAILEVAGVKDVLAKSLGSPNAINTARATMDALQRMKKAEEVGKLRGRKLTDMLPKGMLAAMTTLVPSVTVEEETEEVVAVEPPVKKKKPTVKAEKVKKEAEEAPVKEQPSVEAKEAPVKEQPSVEAEEAPVKEQPSVEAKEAPIEEQPSVEAKEAPVKEQPSVEAKEAPVKEKPSVKAKKVKEEAEKEAGSGEEEKALTEGEENA